MLSYLECIEEWGMFDSIHLNKQNIDYQCNGIIYQNASDKIVLYSRLLKK